VGKNPAVLLTSGAARNFFGHEAFEMIVKARMGAEQLSCLGPCSIVHMLIGDQRDNFVAWRIPGLGN
jgi:hypothetical protein